MIVDGNSSTALSVSELLGAALEKFSQRRGFNSADVASGDGRVLEGADGGWDRAIDGFRERIKAGYPREALGELQSLLGDFPEGTNPYLLFRAKANIGHCFMQLDQRVEAFRWLQEAINACPQEPRAIALKAYKLLASGEYEQAADYARDQLKISANNDELVAHLIEACTNIPDEEYPKSDIPHTVQDRERIIIARCLFFKQRELHRDWWELAKKGFHLFPNSRLLKLFASEAVVDRVTREARYDRYRSLTDVERHDLEGAAKVLSKLWGDIKASETPTREDGLSALSSSAVAYRVLDQKEKALTAVAELVEATDYEPALVVALQVAQAFHADELAVQVMAKLPDHGQSAFVKGTEEFNRGNWKRALELFAKADIPEVERALVDCLSIVGPLQGRTDESDAEVLREARERVKGDLRALIVISRIANQKGLVEIADEAFQCAANSIDKETSINTRIMIAACARDREDADSVIKALDGFLDVGVLTPPLIWLSDAFASQVPIRNRGIQFYRGLPKQVREAVAISRSYAHALAETGNLRDAERILRKATNLKPNDAFLAVRFLQVLRRSRKDQEANTVVETVNEKTLEGLPEHIMIWAHELMAISEFQRGLDLGYEIYRKNQHNHRIASAYVGLIIGAPAGLKLPSADRAEVGNWVSIVCADGVEDAFIIDSGIAFVGVDVVSANEERARRTLGLGVGDSFDASGFRGRTQTWTVREIKSKYLHVLHVTMQTFRTRYPESTALFQFSIKDGDIGPILDEVKKSSDTHRQALKDMYVDKHLPLSFVARGSGTDVISISQAIRAMDRDIVTSGGLIGDRDLGVAGALRAEQRPIVIDTYTAITTAHFKALSFLRSWFSDIFIAQSTLDEINELIVKDGRNIGKGVMTLGHSEGNFYKQEMTSDLLKDQMATLNQIRQEIEANCKVRPVTMPDELSDEIAQVARTVGVVAMEPLFLAKSECCALLSDDAFFRSFAAQMIGIEGTWTQAVLIAARLKGQISGEKLSDFYVALAWRRHANLWLDVESLTLIYDHAGSADFARVCRSIGQPGADMLAHTNVASQIISQIWSRPSTGVKREASTSVVLSALIRLQGKSWARWIAYIHLSASNVHLKTYITDWIVGHFLDLRSFDHELTFWRRGASARQG